MLRLWQRFEWETLKGKNLMLIVKHDTRHLTFKNKITERHEIILNGISYLQSGAFASRL